MKKAIPLFALILVLLLAGCRAKNYTPEIPLTLTQNVRVTSGDFYYDCKICKTEDSVSVTVDSTSAKGLVMTYDGKNLNFKFTEFSYDINAENYERQNAAIVIYEVFDFINSAPELNVKKIDGGFKYEGKISIGDFVLIQNDDNSFSTLTVRNADYRIEFIN